MKNFEQELEVARKAKIPVMALRMFKRPDREDDLDDVVVDRPKLFRAEMMDDGTLWMACYFDNDERVSFYVQAKKKGWLDFSVTEKPPEWLDYDELFHQHHGGVE